MAYIREYELSRGDIDRPFQILQDNAQSARMPHASRALERMRESAHDVRARNRGMFPKVVFTTGTYSGEKAANDIHIVAAARRLVLLLHAPIDVPELELVPGDLESSNTIGFPLLKHPGDEEAYHHKDEILKLAGIRDLSPIPEEEPTGTYEWTTASGLHIQEKRSRYDLRLKGWRNL